VKAIALQTPLKNASGQFFGREDERQRAGFEPAASNLKTPARPLKIAIAFSSEVDTGSREENASKQKIRASVLIQSEPKRL
jgi:hypothetical protein